jgi:GNAT superfamily N-acetyltransferase
VTAAFALRAPRRDDLSGVVALFRACDAVEFGRPDTDDADVLAEWDGTGFDLQTDARVAVEPTDGPPGERVIGYAHTFEKHIEVQVHPERNGLGAGTVLREFAETRALEQAVAAAAPGAGETGGGAAAAAGSSAGAAIEVKVWQAPRRTNGTAHRLLEAAGYARGHHYVEMEADLADERQEPAWPEGVSVRTFEPGRDEPACHALQNLAWSQYKTYEAVAFERWCDLTREPDFDPALWFLAEESDVLIGMCLCREYEDQAWVTSLGVHPDARGRRLGEALMLHAFARLRARGIDRVGLSVSSRTTQSAWRLYERVGMHDAGGWVAFEKVLRAGEPG